MEQLAELIRIDKERCIYCNACADECPAGVFASASGRDEDRVSVSSSANCIRCGHCIAVCPRDAIVHKELDAAGFDEIQKRAVGHEEVKHLLLSRRSIRTFSDKGVPTDVLEELIEVATNGGTASNAQTEGFVVIQDRRVIDELEKMTTDAMWARLKPLGTALGRRLAVLKYGEETVNQSISYYERLKAGRRGGTLAGTILRNAPVVIAVHGRKDNLLARENCAIATRNMEILAESRGLGTCWAGLLLIAAGFTDKIAGSFGIPEDRNIYSAIMLGYPKYTYKKTIPRANRETRWL